MMDGTTSTAKPTLYFGYGSNLWQHQMLLRCPTSTYLGVARLSGYRWIINDRGYANVVEPRAAARTKQKEEPVVYGLVYSLLPSDEARLDRNEGVPYAYTKEHLPVEFWPCKPNRGNSWVDVNGKPQITQMLVYIDRKRTQDSTPKEEYVYRMNMGINDALAMGVPRTYVDRVMRSFIPDKDDKEVKKMAQKQALDFEDET